MPDFPPRIDAQGRVFLAGCTEEQVFAMSNPVRCLRCGGVYDLGRVTVVARYSDCSVWRSPCCDIETDDRTPGWGGPRSYEEIDTRPPEPPRRPHGMFPWEG